MAVHREGKEGLEGREGRTGWMEEKAGMPCSPKGRVPRWSPDLRTRAGPWAAADTGDHRFTGMGEPIEALPRACEPGRLTHKYWLC